jgi:hypothetical protein
MTDDLAKRLRFRGRMGFESGDQAAMRRNAVADEAASRIEALEQRVKVLEGALQTISVGEEPRPVGIRWRQDGRPSKLDRCVHEIAMHDTCGQCISEFASSALSQEIQAQGGGDG